VSLGDGRGKQGGAVRRGTQARRFRRGGEADPVRQGGQDGARPGGGVLLPDQGVAVVIVVRDVATIVRAAEASAQRIVGIRDRLGGRRAVVGAILRRAGAVGDGLHLPLGVIGE